MKQVYLDVETTGFSSKKGNIIQLAALVYENGKLVQEYNQYFNPDFPVHPKAQEVHGLSNENLATAPKFAAQTPTVIELLSGNELLGHNIDFDVRFLNEELRRQDSLSVEQLVARVTDTLDLARGRVPDARSHKLGDLVQHLDLGAQAAQHDALEDVRLTRRLHEKLLSLPAPRPPPPRTPAPEMVWKDSAAPEPTPEPLSVRRTTLEYDAAFIETLIEKLKGHANLNSVHLNARPGVSNKRLPASALPRGNDFISKLLTEPNFSCEFTCAVPPAIAAGSRAAQPYEKMKRRLQTMEIENNDKFQEFGIKNFALGYPLFIKRSERNRQQVIKAPLFIWNLTLKRAPGKKNTWVVERTEDSPITVNETLLAYLEKDHGKKLKELTTEHWEDSLITYDDIITYANRLAYQLDPTTVLGLTKAPPPLEFMSEKDWAAPETTSAPVIAWEGIFSLYEPPKAAIIRRLEALRGEPNYQLAASYDQPFQKTLITTVPVDPSKQGIIETLTRNEIKVIQGPPGTGKSQCITAIIDNALANGQKTIVVCEKQTALKVIYENLAQHGLEDYALLINDAKKDRTAAIKKARELYARENNAAPPTPAPEPPPKYLALRRQLAKKYQILNKPIIAGLTWRDLVSRTAAAPPPQLTLRATGFKLTEPEFQHLNDWVKQAQSLYAQVAPAAFTGLAALAQNLFTPPPTAAAQEEFNQFLGALQRLQGTINEQVLPDYAEFSRAQKTLCQQEKLAQLAGSLGQAQEHCAAIKKLLQRAATVGYKNFHRRNLTNFLRRALFIGRSAGRENFKELHQKYINECAQLEKIIRRLGKSALPPCPPHNLSRTPVTRVTGRLENLMRYFRAQLADVIKIEKIQRLTGEIHAYDKYFATPVKNYRDYPDFTTYLNAVRAQCAVGREWHGHQQYYSAYHAYQHYKQAAGTAPRQQALLTALEAQPSADWQRQFQNWYYCQVRDSFALRHRATFINNDEELAWLPALEQELRQHQIPATAAYWAGARRKHFQKAQKYFVGLYNLGKNKQYGDRNSLKKVIDENSELFQTLFPVILTNPETANLLLGGLRKKSKFVIFDEASQIKLEDAFSALSLGDHKIIVGDEHQMPPARHFESGGAAGPAESLLDYATALKDVSKSYLDFHYRSTHPALIAFSNASFYGGNLYASPPPEDYVPIDFRNIAGEYIDKENDVPKNINYDEVEEIMHILKHEVHPNAAGRYPTLGVAATNSKQRNEIIDRITVEVETDPEFAEKYAVWEQEGFFVKNLENVQGEERDIMILSTVFGKTAAGTFRQNLGNINKNDGYRFINVLVTRAKMKLYVVTSIPAEVYRNYDRYLEPESPNNKHRLFYAYLAYAEAVSTPAPTAVTEILEEMQKNTLEAPRHRPPAAATPILEHIHRELEKFKPATTTIIPGATVAGYAVDFLVTAGGKALALDYDDKITAPPALAGAYHHQRKNELARHGCAYHVIRPHNWLEAPVREINKILSQVKINGNKLRPSGPQRGPNY